MARAGEVPVCKRKNYNQYGGIMNFMTHKLLILLFMTLTPLSYSLAYGFNNVSITTSPEIPKPKEFTTIKITSFSYNLNSVNIQWLLNGDLVKEGVGLSNISLQAPEVGKSIKVEALVGDLTAISTVLKPISIDILWEADTVTPQWYLGRALPVDQSKIKAVAIPHIDKQASKNLIFNWFKDGKPLKQLSGVGSDHIIITAPGVYNDYILSVEVSDSTGRNLGSNGVKVLPVTPEVILYNTVPLLGTLYNEVIPKSGYVSRSIEPSFIAMPFYFSMPSTRPLQYKWSVNGARYTQNNIDEITLINPSGALSISASISNPDHILQSSNTHKRIQAHLTSQIDIIGTGYESQFGPSE